MLHLANNEQELQTALQNTGYTLETLTPWKRYEWEKLIAMAKEFRGVGQPVNVWVETFDHNDGHGEQVEGFKADISAKHPVWVKPGWAGKKYNFWLDRNYNNSLLYGFKEVEPNNVGVPTFNKIQRWVDYLQKKGDYIRQREEEIAAKVAQFVTELEAAGIPTRKDQTRRRITFSVEKNGVEYFGDINTETGCINQDVRLGYSLRNLKGFLALSNHQNPE